MADKLVTFLGVLVNIILSQERYKIDSGPDSYGDFRGRSSRRLTKDDVIGFPSPSRSHDNCASALPGMPFVLFLKLVKFPVRSLLNASWL
jgi:hypothetical protein